MQPSFRFCFSALSFSSHFPTHHSPAARSRMVFRHQLMKVLVGFPFSLPQACYRKISRSLPLFLLEVRTFEYVRVAANGQESLFAPVCAGHVSDAELLGSKQPRLRHGVDPIARDDVPRYTPERPAPGQAVACPGSFV